MAKKEYTHEEFSALIDNHLSTIEESKTEEELEEQGINLAVILANYLFTEHTFIYNKETKKFINISVE